MLKLKKPDPQRFPFTDASVRYVATVTPEAPDESVVTVAREDGKPITDSELLESLETYALENVVTLPDPSDWGDPDEGDEDDA